MKRAFEDFITPGYISVWVGDFSSEDDCDDYLLDEFSSEFGFEIRPTAVRELGVEPVPVRIDQLVQGFSRSSAFASKVVDAARAYGITMASSMFIIYNFRYEELGQTVQESRMKFIGAVAFPGFG